MGLWGRCDSQIFPSKEIAPICSWSVRNTTESSFLACFSHSLLQLSLYLKFTRLLSEIFFKMSGDFLGRLFHLLLSCFLNKKRNLSSRWRGMDLKWLSGRGSSALLRLTLPVKFLIKFKLLLIEIPSSLVSRKQKWKRLWSSLIALAPLILTKMGGLLRFKHFRKNFSLSFSIWSVPSTNIFHRDCLINFLIFCNARWIG